MKFFMFVGYISNNMQIFFSMFLVTCKYDFFSSNKEIIGAQEREICTHIRIYCIKLAPLHNMKEQINEGATSFTK